MKKVLIVIGVLVLGWYDFSWCRMVVFSHK